MKHMDATLTRFAMLLAAAALSFVGLVEAALGTLGASHIDAAAAALIDDIAFRAAAAFAISKSINAGLSFVQEIAISGNVIVAGGSFHPASFLEPINNLFDQFALAMLLVAAAAATIGLLLKMGASWGVSVVLTAGLLMIAATLPFRARPGAQPFRRRLTGLALAAFSFAFLLRIALPTAIALTGALSDRFLAEPFDAAQSDLKQLEAQVEQTATESRDDGWIKRLSESAGSAWAAVSDRFSNAFDSIVTMIAVFVLETVILPLGLIWALWRIMRVLVSRSPPPGPSAGFPSAPPS